jgi:phosphate transport system substrate-binding protein
MWRRVQGLFSGRITDWSQIGGRAGAVRLYARDDKSGTFDTFQSLVLGDSQLRTDARRFESNAELTRAVAMDSQAIGFTGLAAVGTAKPLAVHAEQTQPLLPQNTVVATEDYLLARRLYLYHAKEPSDLVQSLVDFALSDAGQRIVERVGYVPLRIEAVTESPRPGVPLEYAELISGAQRLTLNFRFGSGLSLLDSKAERDIERLVAFMQQPANAQRELVVTGFADSSEGTPFFSLSISNDRVDYVAERLARAGLKPRGAIGFGGAVPVAPNSSELGRLKNRRVEVWLR